jgi:hypothetical protein
VIEPMIMNVYGNVFVSEQNGLLSSVLRTQFNKVLRVEKYGLTLARRAGA